MRISLFAVGVHETVFAAGYKVAFLLADGAIVELVAPVETAPVADATTDVVFSSWSPVFPLERSQVDALGRSPAVAFRATVPAGEVTWDVGKGDGKDLATNMQCSAAMMP